MTGINRGVEITRYSIQHLDGIVALCEQEGWATLTEDPSRTAQALCAPGVVTIVALDGDAVVGFAQVLTDGAIEAYLSRLLVSAAARRRGIGRRLVDEALERSSALRLDLLAADGSQAFYRSFRHHAHEGFRLYPATSEG